jgi:hydrogenase nickel incorporation protein HypA/HybF
MHEFSIAEALLEAALGVAQAHGSHPVEDVCVRIGRLRQVLPEALHFAFDALTPGTLAEGATLTWEEVPPRIRCQHCGIIFMPAEVWFWTCPDCGTSGGEVIEGEELVLESVRLKEEPDGNPCRSQGAESER